MDLVLLFICLGSLITGTLLGVYFLALWAAEHYDEENTH